MDGSAIYNPRMIGAGRIKKDQHGKMLMEFVVLHSVGTNNIDELVAAIFGMTWGLEKGYMKILL